jgi:hypothetical protein
MPRVPKKSSSKRLRALFLLPIFKEQKGSKYEVETDDSVLGGW